MLSLNVKYITTAKFNQQKRIKKMKLGIYLKKYGIKVGFFAQQIGVKQPQLSRWIHGRKTPTVIYAIKIEDATGGKVTCRDWLPEIESLTE